MIRMIRKIFSCLSDLLFPPSCILCGEYLKGETYVCRECLESLPLNKNESSSHMSVFDYGDHVRHLIHELKYNRRPEIGIILGREAGKRLSGIIDPAVSLLVPVPLHKKRLRKRGYNQTEMICEGLSEELLIPVRNKVLKRVRNNVSQTTLNAEGRSHNVKGIFETDQDIENKFVLILLVDDVITTGATTKEAGSVLKNAGYENYFSLSIATVK